MKPTTIRVTAKQHDLLRMLATQRNATVTATLDEALKDLRRKDFYQAMADAETELRKAPEAWNRYVHDRDSWLGFP